MTPLIWAWTSMEESPIISKSIQMPEHAADRLAPLIEILFQLERALAQSHLWNPLLSVHDARTYASTRAELYRLDAVVRGASWQTPTYRRLSTIQKELWSMPLQQAIQLLGFVNSGWRSAADDSRS